MRKNQGYLVFVLANNGIDTIFVMLVSPTTTAKIGKHETSGSIRPATSTCEIQLHLQRQSGAYWFLALAL